MLTTTKPVTSTGRAAVGGVWLPGWAWVVFGDVRRSVGGQAGPGTGGGRRRLGGGRGVYSQR
jgi:hypothetical protein